MNAKNYVKSFALAAVTFMTVACSGGAKTVHELESSFVGDSGETPVYLNLKDDKTAEAKYKDTFVDVGEIKSIGTGSWTYDGDVKNVATVKIGNVNLEVDKEHGIITMNLAIGDNNGKPTIDCVAEGGFWAVTFKYDESKPNPTITKEYATFEVSKDAHVTDVKVYDFVLGDNTTLATPVEKVSVETGHWIAVQATLETGFAVDKVTFDGAEGMEVAGYYCFNGGTGLTAKKYAINVTSKAAA